METEEKSPPEEDWLLTEQLQRGTHEACMLAMTTVVEIAIGCCRPSLSLNETTELLEAIWYEMDLED